MAELGELDEGDISAAIEAALRAQQKALLTWLKKQQSAFGGAPDSAPPRPRSRSAATAR
jgi:hypothetical protein